MKGKENKRDVCQSIESSFEILLLFELKFFCKNWLGFCSRSGQVILRVVSGFEMSSKQFL